MFKDPMLVETGTFKSQKDNEGGTQRARGNMVEKTA